MSDNSTFRLSFQASHPTLTASDIVDAFDMVPTKLFHSVGEPRLSPSGKSLGGRYRETSVGFDIHEDAFRCDEVDIQELLLEQLAKFDTEETAHIVETGGKCAFAIGLFPDSYIGLELGNAVNDLLSKSKIEMWYYIYGKKD